MEGAKTCRVCGKTKPLSQCVRKAESADGYAHLCLNCSRLKGKEYRISGRDSAGRRANPVGTQLARMIASSRVRAKEKGIDHDLDVEYLRSITPSHCPYLGIELRWEVQNGLGVQNKVYPNSPSLDRIDSSKGYIKGNVAIVSHRANSIKRDATEVELIEIGCRIAELKMQLILDEE